MVKTINNKAIMKMPMSFGEPVTRKKATQSRH